EKHRSFRLINLRALVGRRLVKVGADGKTPVPYASLEFVLGFPEELVRHAHELPKAVRDLAAHRELGETWEVTFGPYRSGAIDPPGGPGAPSGEPAQAVLPTCE